MGPVDAIKSVFQKYATFSGRAGRAEYWWFALFFVVVYLVLYYLTPLLALLFILVTLIPTLAVSVRRLHDTGRSGWWILISLVPLIGALALLYFYVLAGDPGQNKYGSPAMTAAPI